MFDALRKQLNTHAEEPAVSAAGDSAAEVATPTEARATAPEAAATSAEEQEAAIAARVALCKRLVRTDSRVRALIGQIGHPVDTALLEQALEMLIRLMATEPQATAAVEEPKTENEVKIAKYKKMLDMGFPVRAVLTNMGKAGFDISKIDVKFDPADVETYYRPLYSVAKAEIAQSTEEKKAAIALARRGLVEGSLRTARRKKLFVSVVPKASYYDALEREEPWLWSREHIGELTMPFSEEVYKLFEKMFTQDPMVKDGAVSRTRMARALLGKNACQRFEPMLRELNLSPEEFRDRLLNSSFTKDQVDQLKSLLSVWPTEDEERAIKAFDGDVKCLEKLEQIFVSMRDLPRSKEKIECLVACSDFASQIHELSESMILVVRCINQILGKKTFVAVMQCLSALISVLNHGRTASEAELRCSRFRMLDLLKLIEARSFDVKKSTLRVFVEAIETDKPHLGAFTQELTLLPKCAAESDERICSQLKSLETVYEKLIREQQSAAADITVVGSATASATLVNDLFTFSQSIANSAFEAKKLLEKPQEYMRDFKDACRRLNAFLGEADDTPLTETIVPLAAFVKAFAVERAKQRQVASAAMVPSSAPLLTMTTDFESTVLGSRESGNDKQ